MARAICVAHSDNPDHFDKAWQEYTWTNYIDHANAAIDALMEPTEGMIERGGAVYGQSLYVPIANKGYGERAKIVFQAMIDPVEEA